MLEVNNFNAVRITLASPDQIRSWNIYGIEQRGRSINYKNEDPYVREYYFSRLRDEGVEPDMPESQFV